MKTVRRIQTAIFVISCLSGAAGVASPAILITPTAVTGAVGMALSQTFTASGGTAPYTFAETGGLPAGVTFLGDTLSGTPTASGTFPITVSVADKNGAFGSQSVTLTMSPPTITVSPAGVTGIAGTALTQAFTASGGTAPYSFTETGALPMGLTFAAGTLSGTPTASGASSITVTATDKNGATGSQTVAITINPAPPTIVVSPASVTGMVGTALSQAFSASGGAAPYTFAETGALPAGLTFVNGTLSGTPLASGMVTITVTATDKNGATGSRSVAIAINPAPPTIVVTPAAVTGMVGTALSQGFSASGGAAPYTFTETGALPAGLIFANGMLTGTPTASGPFPITVTATDKNGATGSQSVTITINPAPPTITVTPASVTGTVGTALSQSFTASGGATPYTFAETGALPAGLTFANGALSGTPTAGGMFPITVTATDKNGATGSQSVTITISQPTITVGPATVSGTVGTALSQSFTASGGTGPYTFIQTGTLPAGLSFSGNTLSGTPTASGAFTITIMATDKNGAAGSQIVAITISQAPLSIAAPSLPNGTVGTPYPSTQLTATGGTAPYNFSVASGSLPTGLMLSSGGAIAGSPNASGASTFTVKVTDSSSPAQSGTSGPLSITINPAPLSVSTSSLPPGTAGTIYSASLSASGGTSPYTWTVKTGSLPNGLSLSPTGSISGTPTAAGTSTVTLMATDSANPAQSAVSGSLSIVIAPPALNVTTAPLPTGAVGAAYSAALVATGGTPPYVWSLNSGSLPAGIALGPDGSLTGTPSATGTSTFTVKVSDASSPAQTAISGSLSIAINPAALNITTTSLAAGVVGQTYTASLNVTGGTAPYSWTLNSGSLPAGVSLSANGSLSGTPTSVGNFTITAKVTDSTPTPQSAVSNSLTIQISPPALSIQTGTLPNGAAGSAYAGATVTATGGTPPYTWSIVSGGLPAGLILNSTTGAISGTPSLSGSFTFTVQVNDTGTLTSTRQFTIVIAPVLIITTSPTLPSGTAGAPYGATLSATGGTQPYSWSLSGGALPDGLTLSSSGAISGTPSRTGTFNFTAQALDSTGTSASKQFTLNIATSLTIVTSSLPGAISGGAYSQTLGASGGTPPYLWSLAAGSLPSGLSLNNSTGAISGTPVAAGNFSFTIQVADNTSATATKAFGINVANPPTIVTASPLSNGTTTVPYNQTLAATGGTPPYTWSVTSGSLPTGLTLASSGLISGTPTLAGISNFSVQVTDAASLSATKQFQIAVQAILTITTTSLPPGTAGAAYNQTLGASGGAPPYTWSIISGSLPAGLSLSSNGTIGGIAASVGPGLFSAQVRDNNGVTAVQQFTINVGQGLSFITQSALPNGSVGNTYSAIIVATGGTAPYSYVLSGSGQLPAGLTLSSPGLITGTPLSPVTANFQVQVTDAAGTVFTGPFTIAVVRGLTITTSPALPGGTAGSPYSAIVAASGGTAPYSWVVTGGSLPAGLSLNAGSGQISGTPTAPGTANFTLQATDAASASANKQFSLAIAPPLTLNTSALPGATAGSAYSQTLDASGGTQPYAWSIIAGSLPDGLALNASTGAITGTPSGSGPSVFTVQVLDGAGSSASKPLTIAVSSVLSILTGANLPGATAGVAYSQALVAGGGTPPYVWSDTGSALPPGLSLSPSGMLGGTPAAPGSFVFTLKVTDSASASLTQQFTLAVGSGLTIGGAGALPDGIAGVSYSQSLTASGGIAPFSWAVSGGALPAGLTLDPASGAISGTPPASGASSFTVRITDSTGAAATANFTINIGLPALPPMTLTGIKDVTDPASQVPFNLTLASGFPAPINGTVTLDFQPDGTAPTDDPAVQFATGGRSVDFTVPPNATSAAFPIPQMLFQTGTVSGTINLRVSLQSNGAALTTPPDLNRSTRIVPAAPVIRAARIVKNGASFELRVTAFSTPREVAQAAVTFTAAPGSNLQTTTLTVPLSDLAKQWYQSAASAPFGSLFVVTLPFTIQGAQDAIQSVTMSLVNSQGSSAAFTMAF